MIVAFVELDSFEMSDGSCVAVGDVIWGDNEHDMNTRVFERMEGASHNVEHPFDRGLEKRDDGEGSSFADANARCSAERRAPVGGDPGYRPE